MLTTSQYSVVIFAISLSVVRCAPFAPGACPQEMVKKIQECVTPVVTSAERVGVSFTQRMGVTAMTMDVFTDLCGLINTYDQCLDLHNARSRCPNQITVKLIDSSYGFLCKEGKTIFMEQANCLMKLDENNAVATCHHDTMNRIKETSKLKQFEERTKSMCSSINKFTECIAIPVKEKCSNGAWSIIAKVLVGTTKTLMPSCQLTASKDLESVRFSLPAATTRIPPRNVPYAFESNGITKVKANTLQNIQEDSPRSSSPTDGQYYNQEMTGSAMNVGQFGNIFSLILLIFCALLQHKRWC